MSLNTILDSIKAALSKARPPANVISGLFLVCSMIKRPGLSVLVSTANILKYLGEHGIETGPNEDGTPNQTSVRVAGIVTEIYRAMRFDANVQMAFGPGSMSITASGANAGGPVVVSGTNINHPTGVGIIQ